MHPHACVHSSVSMLSFFKAHWLSLCVCHFARCNCTRAAHVFPVLEAEKLSYDLVAHFEHDKCSGHESLHCECDKRIIFRNSLVAILICGLILWRIVGIRRCTLYRSAFARPKTLSHESYKRKYYRRFDEKKTCLEHASSHLGHIDSKNNTNRIRNGVSYEEIVICSRLR